jgi:FG-GAP-like repeat
MYAFPIFNSTRFVAPLRRAVDGQKLLFVAARGEPRLDGQPNVHHMYRLVHGEDSYFTHRNFDFIEEPGTTTGGGVGVEGMLWKVHTRASCLLTVDLNMDGRDDVLICNQQVAAGIFLQHSDGSWSVLPTAGMTATADWANARAGDVTGDGVVDLVVVGRQQPSYVKVFAGSRIYPHFNFTAPPYFDLPLPWAAPDVGKWE